MSEEQPASGTAVSSEAAQAEIEAAPGVAETARAESLAATEALMPQDAPAGLDLGEQRVFDAPALAQMIQSGEGVSDDAMNYSAALLQDRLGLSQEESKGIMYALAQGTNAQRELATYQLYDSVGGESAYGDLKTWAETALAPNEIEEFNGMLNGAQSLDDQKAALQFLKNKKTQREGAEPQRLQGDTTPEPTIKPIQSRDEYMELMRDPRYDKDPSYRDAVESRLQAGIEQGVYQILRKY